eukprot:TRINITY_DN3961_c0_g1_i4.p1 TRINITY_DN3961_c0_g1~~TRINITY_DN3961_c0_g1_i4.p1  ORF type:complete len:251 (+),score=73.20 TRINITY_DN3961_c0_g1_i4:64-816(+)
MCIRDRSTQSTWGIKNRQRNSLMSIAPITFGYWPTRRRAEPIRLMFEVTGVAYKMKIYNTPDEWNADRVILSKTQPFVNIPYIQDGDFFLVESEAIAEYIAQKGKRPELMGKEGMDQITFLTAKGAVWDFFGTFLKLGIAWFTDPNVIVEANKIMNTTGKPYLERISKFLGAKPFLVGDYYTFADFSFYEVLQWVKAIAPEVLEEFPNLKEFVARIEAIPEIAAYHKSDRYQPRKFLSAVFQMKLFEKLC